VPVAIKDNICVRGMRTTAGSRMLAAFVPPYNATAAARLEAAGALIVGKTNCDEFAMGSSNEHSAFGPAHNPWDLARTPGGSSGGSAAAVASRMVPLALGSDTGGSVRQPAGFCGCVGIRPTYGRVSRHGLVAFASSLDQIGPLAMTVRDAAAALQVIAGPDGLDSTAAAGPAPEWGAALTGDVRGCRIGVPARLLDRGVDADVGGAFTSALEVFRSRGAAVREIDLVHAALSVPVYYVVATAEASSNLARYDGVRYGHRAAGAADLRSMYERTREEGFGAEVKRRVMLGTFVLSAGYYDAYYLKAQRVRTLISRDLTSALETVDVIALPTSPAPPFLLGERLHDPLSMYLEDVFTVGASLAGLPALSVPCGFTPAGLPIGLQLVGRPFDESTILRAAEAYERDTGYWRTPPSGAGRGSGA
jgi:aspartyl-tRNA(Asn)/glutamyl-tRNA(Gln) amidotransferase subunit A